MEGYSGTWTDPEVYGPVFSVGLGTLLAWVGPPRPMGSYHRRQVRPVNSVRLSGLLSSYAVEVLEAAIKSCDGVWQAWTIGDVGAGATLVATTVGPQETNAGAKAGTAGFVPTPGTLVTTARLTMAEEYSTPDVVADAARRRTWLQVFGQRVRPTGALIRVRDVPWLAGWWRPFDVETMETGARGRTVLCMSNHARDQHGQSREAGTHGG